MELPVRKGFPDAAPVASIQTRSSLGRFEADRDRGKDGPSWPAHSDEPMADPVNLTLPPTSSSLPELRRAVARALGAADDDLVADVLLALDEAVSNAVRHGSRGGEPVMVSVDSDGEWVEMSVLDGGPTARLPRLPAEPPPVLHTGGRGLWLILQLVDEVRLQRVGEGTRLVMRRRVASKVDSLVGRDGGG
jgi:serine/threonine-protein kinase RsbW